MFSNILVPLDGSPLAEQALPIALHIAGNEPNTRITLLRVPQHVELLMPVMAGNYGTLVATEADRVADEAAKYLHDLAEKHSTPNLTVDILVVAGDVAAAIVDTAAQNPYDLIVMATHGYTGLKRFLLGSVAEKVLRHAKCPVYVVREGGKPKTILAPFDGSPRSESGLPFAVTLASHFKAKLVFTHCVEPIDDISRGILEEVETGLGRTMQERLVREAEVYLTQLSEAHKNQNITIEVDVVSASPATGVLDLAQKHNADLIVMATHGRTGVNRWVYGSVTEKVLRHAHCSLLVARNTPTDE